ncbi:MAG: helix-turn-helix domain-containing protein [Sphingomonadaceae bacterium]
MFIMTPKHQVVTSRRMVTREIAVMPVPEYDSAAIKAVREQFGLSQAALAAILNASLPTIKAWEGGSKRPSGTAAKLLDVLSRKGLEALC